MNKEEIFQGIKKCRKSQWDFLLHTTYKVYINQTNGYKKKIKAGFNWPVLLLGPCWFFYHGMAGKGIMWLFIAFLSVFPLSLFGPIIVWIIAGTQANKGQEKELLNNGWVFDGYSSSKYEECNNYKQNKENQSTYTNHTNDSIPEQIEKLAELKAKGIITEREFEDKKKELLAKM